MGMAGILHGQEDVLTGILHGQEVLARDYIQRRYWLGTTRQRWNLYLCVAVKTVHTYKVRAIVTEVDRMKAKLFPA